MNKLFYMTITLALASYALTEDCAYGVIPCDTESGRQECCNAPKSLLGTICIDLSLYVCCNGYLCPFGSTCGGGKTCTPRKTLEFLDDSIFDHVSDSAKSAFDHVADSTKSAWDSLPSLPSLPDSHSTGAGKTEYPAAMIKGFLEGLHLYPEAGEDNDCKASEIVELLKTPCADILDYLVTVKDQTREVFYQKFGAIINAAKKSQGSCSAFLQKKANIYNGAGDDGSDLSDADRKKYRKAFKAATKLTRSGEFEDGGKAAGEIVHDIALH
jgi:hypothetical protein